MNRRSNREFDLQVACVKWFKLSYKPAQAILFAVPNGGSRNLLEAANLKKAGVVAGVADLILVCRAGVLFVELKTESNSSRQSPSQKEFQAMVESLGHTYIVVRNIGDFMRSCAEFFCGIKKIIILALFSS